MEQFRQFILQIIKESNEEPEDVGYIAPVDEETESEREAAENEAEVAEAFGEQPTPEQLAKKRKAAEETEYDAYGKPIAKVDELGNPIKKKERAPWVEFRSLYFAARKLGYTSAKLLDPELDTTRVATDFAALIEAFRNEEKPKEEIKKVYGLEIDKLLSGQELIDALKVSLIRGQVYFWSAFNVYQTANSTAQETAYDENDKIIKVQGAKFTSAYLPQNTIYTRIFSEPKLQDIKDLNTLLTSYTPEQQALIKSKPDRLTKYLGMSTKRAANEMRILSTLDYLKEASENLAGGEHIDDAKVKKAHEKKTAQREKRGREVAATETAPGDISIAPPASAWSDSVSFSEDAKNELFKRYINGILRTYAVATKEDIPNIDQKISEYTAHPVSILRDLKSRSTQSRTINRNANDASNLQLLDTGSYTATNPELPLEDPTEDPRTAGSFLDTGTLGSEKTDESNRIFASNNFLIKYFSNLNYASFVACLLEEWAKDPDKYLVTLFSKADKKLVQVNLIHWLALQPSTNLNTKDTKITELQVDVLSLVEYLLDTIGNPVAITDDVKKTIALKFNHLIKLYSLYDFMFIGKSATSPQKEELRQALGLEDLPVYSTKDTSIRSNVETGAFKDKVIAYIENPYFTGIAKEYKQAIISGFEALEKPEEILRAAYKTLPGTVVKNLLQTSSDKDVYVPAKQELKTDTSMIKKAKAKVLAGTLTPFRELDRETLVKYFTFKGQKISEKELPKFLEAADVATLRGILGFVSQDLNKIPRNSKLLDNINELIKLNETESEPLKEAVDNIDEVLQGALLKTFVDSLVAPLQEIGTELHKLGLFLMAFAQNPSSYLPNIKSDNAVVVCLRSQEKLLPKITIEKILDVYKQIKDKPLAEFDPMLEPSFKKSYRKMKDWLITKFSGTSIGKDLKQGLYDAEIEGDWDPLKQVLMPKLPLIREMLGSRGDKNRGGSILHAIEGLCQGRYIVTGAVSEPNVKEEEQARLKQLQAQRKAASEKLGSLFRKPVPQVPPTI